MKLRRLRVPRPAWAALLSLLVMAGTGGGAPGALVAQTVSDLQQRQSDYNAARSAVEAARTAQQAQELRWQEALAEIARARRADDPDRLEAAHPRAWAASAEVTRLRQVVAEAEAQLARARDGLGAALERQMDLIEGQLSTATPQEAPILSDLYRGYEAQHAGLRSEAAAQTSTSRLSYLSNMVPDLDPLWPPEVKLAQIEILDRRVQDLRAEIARVDEEIDDVTTRLDRRRRFEESASSLGRFGATDPVGTTRTRPPGAATPAEVPAGPISLEQLLEYWEAHKSELELLMRSLDLRVAEFRRSVPGAGGS